MRARARAILSVIYDAHAKLPMMPMMPLPVVMFKTKKTQVFARV